MDLNAKGLFHVLSEVLKPGYLEEPGSIFDISSVYSAHRYRRGAVFSASKHAVAGMVKSAGLKQVEGVSESMLGCRMFDFQLTEL